MNWIEEQRNKLFEDYKSGKITREKFNEIHAALYMINEEKTEKKPKSKTIILSITIILFISIFIFYDFYRFTGKKSEEYTVKRNKMSEQTEIAVKNYYILLETYTKDAPQLADKYGRVDKTTTSWGDMVTPFFLAENKEAISSLIFAGADVNMRVRFGMTPLMQIVTKWNADYEIIDELVYAGADVNAKDDFGMTPLMWAAKSCKDPEIIKILLQYKANPNTEDSNGKKAIDYAKGNEALIKTEALMMLKDMSY